MTGRLRDGIFAAWLSFTSRLRPLPRSGAAVKGCVRNVIVVKPDDPTFKEAVFILRDDYFAAGQSRSALVAQAKDAARRYTDSVCPPRRGPLLPAILALLACAGLFTALILTGVI